MYRLCTRRMQDIVNNYSKNLIVKNLDDARKLELDEFERSLNERKKELDQISGRINIKTKKKHSRKGQGPSTDL